MPKFDIILMDADDTLLDYPADSHAAFANALHCFGREWSRELEDLYQSFNQAAWRRLERGELTKEELEILRFEQLFAALGIEGDPAEFNRIYMDGLANGGRLLPGALELCRALSPQAKLFIITNGTARTQRGRFARCGLLPYLQKLYISDEIGYQKPHREFFDFVLQDIRREQGAFDPARVLVYGDSLTSDMQGGINAGLKTCWYAPGGGKSTSLAVDYIIPEHDGLLRIVLGDGAS